MYYGTSWKYRSTETSASDGTSVQRVKPAWHQFYTASHCVYDNVNMAFARNVLFIPDQADTTGTGTDFNCNNDPYGCWVPPQMP
jgi:hypothetical protein